MFNIGSSLSLLVWIAGTVGWEKYWNWCLAGCLTLRISNTDGEHQIGEKKIMKTRSDRWAFGFGVKRATISRSRKKTRRGDKERGWSGHEFLQRWGRAGSRLHTLRTYSDIWLAILILNNGNWGGARWSANEGQENRKKEKKKDVLQFKWNFRNAWPSSIGRS